MHPHLIICAWHTILLLTFTITNTFTILLQIQNKHWRSMRNQDQYLSKVFKEPPMTAFRRENNLRSLLIRSKVPEVPKIHEERKIKGMKQCGNACPACPYILEGKHIRINKNKKWTLNNKFTCETFNIVYMIECQKDQCKMRYIALCRSRRRERKRGLNCVFKEQTVFRQYSALGMDCTLGGPNYLL